MKSREAILDSWYEVGMHWKASNRYNILKAMDECTKQESISLLKWLLTPNEEMTITSGDNCWYVNGKETSHEKLFELFKSKQV